MTKLNFNMIYFFRLLNCIANLINSPERGELASFLEACRIRPPMPGHTLKVTYNAGHSVFTCQCPDNKLPSIPENVSIDHLYNLIKNLEIFKICSHCFFLFYTNAACTIHINILWVTVLIVFLLLILSIAIYQA